MDWIDLLLKYENFGNKPSPSDKYQTSWFSWRPFSCKIFIPSYFSDGEDCGDAQGDAGGDVSLDDPKGDPGATNNEVQWEINSENVEPHLPLKVKGEECDWISPHSRRDLPAWVLGPHPVVPGGESVLRELHLVQTDGARGPAVDHVLGTFGLRLCNTIWNEKSYNWRKIIKTFSATEVPFSAKYCPLGLGGVAEWAKLERTALGVKGILAEMHGTPGPQSESL